MGVRKTSFSSGEYYHLYNRGNSKQAIFLDAQDYNYFLKILFVGNSEKAISNIGRIADVYSVERGQTLISIGAYCLMPNHFHLFIKAKDETSISKCMLKVGTSYAMYFNKKYKRTGALFEGKYKATHISEDTYFQYLFAYIHLNPAKLLDASWKEKMKHPSDEMKAYVKDYHYSSYKDYLYGTKRRESILLEKEQFPFVFLENDPEKSVTQWFFNY